jgi:hypothetical protein
MNVLPSYSPWIGKLRVIGLISMRIHIHNLPNLLEKERGHVRRVQLNYLYNKVTISVHLQTERCLQLQNEEQRDIVTRTIREETLVVIDVTHLKTGCCWRTNMSSFLNPSCTQNTDR